MYTHMMSTIFKDMEYEIEALYNCRKTVSRLSTDICLRRNVLVNIFECKAVRS